MEEALCKIQRKRKLDNNSDTNTANNRSITNRQQQQTQTQTQTQQPKGWGRPVVDLKANATAYVPQTPPSIWNNKSSNATDRSGGVDGVSCEIACQNFLQSLHALLSQLPASSSSTTIPTDATPLSTTTTTTNTNGTETSEWLYNLCSTIPSPLDTLSLSLAIRTACQSPSLDLVQAALFDTLGEGERSMEVLFEIVPRAEEIRDGVTEDHLRFHHTGGSSTTDAAAATATYLDPEEERMQSLRQLVRETAETAALAKAEAGIFDNSNSSNNNTKAVNTHAITRKSDKDLQKRAKRATKEAATALHNAISAGAILDHSDPSAHPSNNNATGARALYDAEVLAAEAMGMTENQLHRQQKFNPQLGLIREYRPKSTLPSNSTRTHHEGYELVTIPAPHLDPSQLHNRIKLADAMTRVERLAFKGTESLNPMQSSVFEAAFKSTENLLVCAPTGAGKTNVAMLAVVAHLRDRGLLPYDSDDDDDDDDDSYDSDYDSEEDSYDDNEDDPYASNAARNQNNNKQNNHNHNNNNQSNKIGSKIIYIAPMKALAQEITSKFSSKLAPAPLRLSVRELTGDMQLTRAEADKADIIVTTPEKWDVVTRKHGDGSLSQSCGLLIIDEVHLLADERGAVIESVVARLLRVVESSQRSVRIVGLSATLPNYLDVGEFLRARVFHFGSEYRPVPLCQKFAGVLPVSNAGGGRGRWEKEKKMNEICYDVVVDSMKRGYQVMVFVHSRKGTGETARAMAEIASLRTELDRYFITQGSEANGAAHTRFVDKARKSRNKEVSNHFQNGMGIHHAGMLRGDRKLTETMFAEGAIKVLCCTATLAWGINLPAHTVVIKGTDIYNPEKGTNVDLSILDVQQIFGRAGRPQYDTSGEATLITSHEALNRYLDKLVRATPIESNFIRQLHDHLNAEIVGGTVTTLAEGAEWLQYTYLHVRMKKNPIVYGINATQYENDPTLRNRSMELITEAAVALDRNRMIRYDASSGNLSVTDLGRVASHYYIRSESVATFHELLEQVGQYPSDADLLHVLCHAGEFENVRVRGDELTEVDELKKRDCPLEVKAPVEEFSGKTCVLLQAYISRSTRVKSFTLISDTNYIASNCSRVARALFEMCLKVGEAGNALKLLRMAKGMDRRVWWFQTPLRQFEGEVPTQALKSIESKGQPGTNPLDVALSLLDMQEGEVGQFVRWSRGGSKLKRLVRNLPILQLDCVVKPVTRGILRFDIAITPTFDWNSRWHGGSEGFWVWVEDSDNNRVYHSEQVLFHRRNGSETVALELTIPVFEPLPPQYFIRAISDSWVGVEMVYPVSFQHLLLPSHETPFTDLIDLTPLPTTALQNPKFEQLYNAKFETFNPIQTQLFHVLYHTDNPVLLGAPTGSGKTIVAEIALLRMKKENPSAKCVYIAPLKSLARERLKEWKKTLGTPPLNWKVLELSGDTHHDGRSLKNADVLVCTPEKWDLISRGWRGDGKGTKGKQFVKDVRLLVIDEIHLLGEERGSVLEAIISRTRFISKIVQAEQQQKQKAITTQTQMSTAVAGRNNNRASNDSSHGREHGITRIVGLSTALANPNDLADWIGIEEKHNKADARIGLYNFRPAVRPIPMKVHISGFSGKHYCPRMATMNKPCYSAIKEHSPKKPVIIFVASRRQTRLTALDLINYAAGDDNPNAFLGCGSEYAEGVSRSLRDSALQHTITFGIGIHHAGLSSNDREVVEKMFLDGDIQILVATATLAWGVNLPAHLVIVKGTEYFDGKTSRYVDYPVTDVLQMIGRAGRPQFDTEGIACVMVEEGKKNFYKKFLYSPFPVESCFEMRLGNNLNAELAIGTINSVDDCVGYLDWTFFARRVRLNPSYYGAKSSNEDDIAEFLYTTVDKSVAELKQNGCLTIKDGTELQTTSLGIAASKYYLDFKTPKQMLLGLQVARKFLVQQSNDKTQEGVTSQNQQTNESNGSQNYKPFSFLSQAEVGGVASILYAIASTHEFDELPVRHNEEHLNMDLSKIVPWGPDTRKATQGPKEQSFYINEDVMLSPHTKCFLLIQAYITGAELPISDYIVDTRLAIEQIPRLLAAMEHIALGEKHTAGNFDLVCMFSAVRRVINLKMIPGINSLEQLPDLPRDGLRKLKNSSVSSITHLIAMQHSQLSNLLKKIYGQNKLSRVLYFIKSIPQISAENIHVRCTSDKATGISIGLITMDVILNISQGGKRKRGERHISDFNCNIIIGTHMDQFLLAQNAIQFPHPKQQVTSSRKAVAMNFDWKMAVSFGGEDQLLLLRILSEDICGIDLEYSITLN